MNTGTTTARFADNQHNQDYANVLVLVQNAICSGDDRGAAQLCDDAIDLAESLSVAEVRWMQNLSSDLESLCDRELVRERSEPEPAFDARFAEAWLNIENNPDALLALLRVKQDLTPSDRVAYARARAYRLLGFPNVAVAFMRRADELAPEHGQYKVLLLGLLQAQGNKSEIDKLADEIFISSGSEPEVVIYAASTAVMQTRYMSLDEAKPRLGQIRRVLKSVLDHTPLQTLEPRTAVMGLFTLGTILGTLKRHSAAQAAYQEALRIDPSNEEVAISYAHSLLHTRPDVADSIFESLVDRGTDYFLPYLIAAKNAGERGEYEECMRLSKHVLGITHQPFVLAQAYEFLAISELELNGPSNTAGDYFQRALSIAPASEQLKNNYSVFLEASSIPTRRNISLSLSDFYERDDDFAKVGASTESRWYTTLSRATSQILAAEPMPFSGQLALA